MSQFFDNNVSTRRSSDFNLRRITNSIHRAQTARVRLNHRLAKTRKTKKKNKKRKRKLKKTKKCHSQCQEKKKRQERKVKENEQERKIERTVRESGCCMLAGSGVLIRWKEVVSCWMHEEERLIEGAEGRQSSHLALKRRLRALFHSSFFLLLSFLVPSLLFHFDPSFTSSSLFQPLSFSWFALLSTLRRFFVHPPAPLR